MRAVLVLPGGSRYVVGGGRKTECAPAIVNVADDTLVADNNITTFCSGRYGLAVTPF